jgi:hypothetical protein
MTAHPWAGRTPDFLLSRTPAGRRLLTPFSPQAAWFLPSLDPGRALPRLGPALYLEPADAGAMVQLLQDSGFVLRAWSPPMANKPLRPDTFAPASPPPDRKRIPLSWPYDLSRMSEKQNLILHSLLHLPPGGGTYTISLQ